MSTSWTEVLHILCILPHLIVLMLSVGVVSIGGCLLEANLAAVEHLLPHLGAELEAVGVLLGATHEGVELVGALLLDDEHARCTFVVAGEPASFHTYSMPLFSSRVLRFLAVENMYDLVSMVKIK